MKNKFLYCFFALLVVNMAFMGCKKNLTAIPNTLLTTESIYTDKNLITSVLAQFYFQENWAQNNDNYGKLSDPDDALSNPGAPQIGNLAWGRDRYRVFDYALVRRLNQFLEGIRSDVSKKSMTAAENANFEGQALFLRAYYYFFMTRTLGGMTIVGDEIFTYTPGMDVVPIQKPRNSEADCYQYVMDQCDLAASKLDSKASINASVANKWAAKLLKARAAVTAAAIAKYTPLRAPGNVMKDAKGTDVVGIPASKADDFYKAALAAAQDVITNSPYTIMKNATNPELAFYNATTIKSGNTEVIWAVDRKLPTVNIDFTRYMAPVSHADAAEGNYLGAPLNLVEAFEYRNGSNPVIQTKNPDGSYKIYNDVEEPFKTRDARLWGTVIWPNALYRGTPVPLKAGELRKTTLPYNNPVFTVSAPLRGVNGVTGPNGPANVSTDNVNKTGFNLRKWLDETPNAGLPPTLSEVWFPRMRLAEAYLIAAEAAFELNQAPVGLPYINFIRDRGRIQPLTLANFTFDKIVNEYRVEFAYEDHRIWDLIRWRLAHIIWNGVIDDPTAQPMALFAYQINVPGDPNNGKWVFDRQRAYRRAATPWSFLESTYYSSINLDWINPNNPNWVKNPYQ